MTGSGDPATWPFWRRLLHRNPLRLAPRHRRLATPTSCGTSNLDEFRLSENVPTKPPASPLVTIRVTPLVSPTPAPPAGGQVLHLLGAHRAADVAAITSSHRRGCGVPPRPPPQRLVGRHWRGAIDSSPSRDQSRQWTGRWRSAQETRARAGTGRAARHRRRASRVPAARARGHGGCWDGAGWRTGARRGA